MGMEKNWKRHCGFRDHKNKGEIIWELCGGVLIMDLRPSSSGTCFCTLTAT